MYSVKCAVCSVNYTVQSGKCVVCTAKCCVQCAVQCAGSVCSVQCRVRSYCDIVSADSVTELGVTGGGEL